MITPIKISLVLTSRGTWSWLIGTLTPTSTMPDYEGGGCDTPEQALREATYAINWASVRNAPIQGNG